MPPWLRVLLRRLRAWLVHLIVAHLNDSRQDASHPRGNRLFRRKGGEP
jgi:hypothetical protein